MTVMRDPDRVYPDRGETPFAAIMGVCGKWPVPQLGAGVYELVDRAMNRGESVRSLARRFNIAERDVLVLCLHHGGLPKGGGRHVPNTTIGFHSGSTYAAHTHPED